MNFDKSLFLTFDIDWASDEIIQDTLDILKENEVKATFFITHESELFIKSLRKRLK